VELYRSYSTKWKMTIPILYRDQWMIAIDKPTGVLVYPGDDPNTEAPIAMKLVRDQINAKVWSVHRLDCPTSGVLLYSLSQPFLQHIRTLFERGGIEKTYYALVVGKTPEYWVCNQSLQKSKDEPQRSAETRITRKWVSEVNGRVVSLLSIQPITGRYHQIRKHLTMSGHPIVGDYRYGDESVNNELRANRLMLHAHQLVLSHPLNDEELIVTAPIPSTFAGSNEF